MLLYDKTSQLINVDEARQVGLVSWCFAPGQPQRITSGLKARQHLFSKQSRDLESISPTQAALKKHVLRTAYQGGNVWGKCLEKEQRLPNPTASGWQRERHAMPAASPGLAAPPAAGFHDADSERQFWLPVWTTVEQVAHWYDLIHCSLLSRKMQVLEGQSEMPCAVQLSW